VTPDKIKETLDDVLKVDYERISERMAVELFNVEYTGDKAAFIEAVKQADATGHTLILEVSDADAAREALVLVGAKKPVLNGANESNYEALSALATEYGVALGVSAANLDALYDTVQALEALGNKNLILDVGTASIKDAFANAVQIRRAALAGGEHSFGYPSLVNTAKLAPGDANMQVALASLFTLKYGSIIILGGMSYAQALPLFGLRQNIFTDPQKPMTVDTGIYPINGADENAPCALTVDFALTYFIVSGEIERSGVPTNLIIPDAGGYSVLTAWAAGKFSAGSISRFIKENDIESKIKNRNLMIPGKVAVLKGELEESLPGWKIIVAPNEAVSLVKFLKEFAA
jgi:acetyl-CoA decarbonylase/synthase complex subunit gamma